MGHASFMFKKAFSFARRVFQITVTGFEGVSSSGCELMKPLRFEKVKAGQCRISCPSVDKQLRHGLTNVAKASHQCDASHNLEKGLDGSVKYF